MLVIVIAEYRMHIIVFELFGENSRYDILILCNLLKIVMLQIMRYDISTPNDQIRFDVRLDDLNQLVEGYLWEATTEVAKGAVLAGTGKDCFL